MFNPPGCNLQMQLPQLATSSSSSSSVRIVGESFPSHEKKDLEKKEVVEHLLASAVMNVNDDDKHVHNDLNAHHECAPLNQEESGGPAQALDNSLSEFPLETEYIDQVRSAFPLFNV